MKGYTLLEVMVATAVIGVLAVVATNLFFSVSRGGTKVQVTAEVNQNGQIVLGTMERLIRNSLTVTSACDGEAAGSLTVVDRYARNIVFSCENVGGTDSYIASNSARLTAENVRVTACSFTCTQDPGGFRPPLVEIDFTLGQKKAGLPGETESGRFKTQVSLRNY
jgi:prepilin-type N-terminal cleavage/methylation domain-containing protein